MDPRMIPILPSPPSGPNPPGYRPVAKIVGPFYYWDWELDDEEEDDDDDKSTCEWQGLVNVPRGPRAGRVDRRRSATASAISANTRASSNSTSTSIPLLQPQPLRASPSPASFLATFNSSSPNIETMARPKNNNPSERRRPPEAVSRDQSRFAADMMAYSYRSTGDSTQPQNPNPGSFNFAAATQSQNPAASVSFNFATAAAQPPNSASFSLASQNHPPRFTLPVQGQNPRQRQQQQQQRVQPQIFPRSMTPNPSQQQQQQMHRKSTTSHLASRAPANEPIRIPTPAAVVPQPHPLSRSSTPGSSTQSLGFVRRQIDILTRTSVPDFSASRAPAGEPIMEPASRSSTPGEAFRNLVPTQDKRVPHPLPPALTLALTLRDRQIPSVLTPKPQSTAIPTISYADAIIFLSAQLESITSTPSSPSPDKKKAATKSKFKSPAKSAAEKHFLTERVIDIALYDPKGVYLIPVRTLKIQSTTTLYSLILILQGLLDSNVHDLALLSNSHTHPSSLHRPSYAQDFTLQTAPKYLVSSIAIKVFLSRSFAALPALKGSSSRSGAQFGGSLGEDDVGEGILEADSMHWSIEGSEMERYWEMYKSIILLASTSTPADLEPMRRPVMNIHSVKKPGGTDMGLAGGGHIFVSAPKVRSTVQLDEEGRELVNNILASFGPNADAKTVSKEQIAKAVADAYAVQQAVKSGKGKEKEESKWNQNDTIKSSHLYGQYDVTLKKAIWAQSGFTGGGYSKDVDVNPVRNWGVYQRAHGDPEVHAAFPLDHVPFEEQDFPPPGQFNCNEDNDMYVDENGTLMSLKTHQPVRMVPYMKVPAALFREANAQEEKERKAGGRLGRGEAPIGEYQHQEFQNTLTAEQQHQLDRMEAAMGFNESDDEEYIPHLCSPRDNRNLFQQEPETEGTNDDNFAVSPSSLQPEASRPRLDKQFLMERTEVRRNRSSDFTGTLAAPMGSFNSFNDFTTHESGCYDAANNVSVQATTSGYENLLSANANQAANFYGNLSFGQTAETFTNGRNRTPQNVGTRNNRRQGETSRFNDFFSNPNPNRLAPTSLSDYNKMLNATPPSGQVTAVGAQRNNDFAPNNPNPRLAGIRFGAHRPPANTATLGSYINAGQNETRTPTSRATNRFFSNSQLRADSPVFTSLHTPPEAASSRPTSSSPAGGVALTGAFEAISRANNANSSFSSDA